MHEQAEKESWSLSNFQDQVILELGKGSAQPAFPAAAVA